MLLVWESCTRFVIFITLLSCTICKDKWGVLKLYCYLYGPWIQDNRLEISLCEITAIQQMQVPIKFGYFWPPGSLFTKKNKRFVASCLFFPNGRLTRKSIQMLPYFAEKNFLCRIKCRKSKFFQGPFLLIKATFKWSVFFPVGKYVHICNYLQLM